MNEHKPELGKPSLKIYFYPCATIDLEFPDSESDDYDYDAQNNEKTKIIEVKSSTKISDTCNEMVVTQDNEKKEATKVKSFIDISL